MTSIEEQITQKGIKKSHIAKMIGVNESTLSRVISGKQISDTITGKIKKYLDSLNTEHYNKE